MIERWSKGAAGESMAEEILVDLADLIHGHPWWRARAALTLDLLGRLGIHPPAQVLDAGCGWGVTLEALERRGYHVLGMDISRRGLQQLDRPGRRYLPETRGAAFADSGLLLDRIFWWGRWLVPALRRHRASPRSRPGQTPSEIYRHYLELPPWPLPWVAKLAFLFEHGPALRGLLRTGTSLFAVARRPCDRAAPSACLAKSPT